MTAGRRLMDLAGRDVPPVTRHPDIACRGVDTAVFFPDEHGDPGPAVAICRRCPHQAECLQWALDTGQTWGVWGGKTAPQRARILTDRRTKETR